MKQKRGIKLLPKRRSGDPRASALAVVLQALFIIVVVQTFVIPVAYDWLRDDSGRPIVPEQISFQVALPTSGAPNREAPRDGGDDKPVSGEPAPDVPVPPLVAPSDVPSGLPAAPAPAGGEGGGGYGDIVGDGGPIRGIRPTFTDQRLWVSPSDIVVAPIVPLDRADTLRLMLERGIQAYADAMDAAGVGERRPGDWTFNLGGKKYGIDRSMIRLGDFSLPTAALAFLPLNNVQSNPVVAERVKRLDSMRREILEQSARQMRDDEFDQAVRALRQRRERERAASRAAQQSMQQGRTVQVDTTRP